MHTLAVHNPDYSTLSTVRTMRFYRRHVLTYDRTITVILTCITFDFRFVHMPWCLICDLCVILSAADTGLSLKREPGATLLCNVWSGTGKKSALTTSNALYVGILKPPPPPSLSV